MAEKGVRWRGFIVSGLSLLMSLYAFNWLGLRLSSVSASYLNMIGVALIVSGFALMPRERPRARRLCTRCGWNVEGLSHLARISRCPRCGETLR